MENTARPTIEIPEWNENQKTNYKPLVVLTKDDEAYLNVWREKARRLYKKYNGIYSQEDEKYLVDPDPFDSKWYIFKIKSKSRKPTPMPSPYIFYETTPLNNEDLLTKFKLAPDV
jgi:hypothetical protein